MTTKAEQIVKDHAAMLRAALKHDDVSVSWVIIAIDHSEDKPRAMVVTNLMQMAASLLCEIGRKRLEDRAHDETLTLNN